MARRFQRQAPLGRLGVQTAGQGGVGLGLKTDPLVLIAVLIGDRGGGAARIGEAGLRIGIGRDLGLDRAGAEGGGEEKEGQGASHDRQMGCDRVSPSAAATPVDPRG